MYRGSFYERILMYMHDVMIINYEYEYDPWTSKQYKEILGGVANYIISLDKKSCLLWGK